jgi:hypothetical protein
MQYPPSPTGRPFGHRTVTEERTTEEERAAEFFRKVGKWVVGGLISAPAFVAIWILDGLTLMLLWNWFMVPILHLVVLGLFAAMGISMTGGFLAHQFIPRAKEDGKKALLDTVTTPAACIVMGFILHFFVK